MSEFSLKLTKKRTLNEHVFEILKEAILNGHLKPGQRLPQDQLAEDMGVSRMPVREAINKLEMQGLIKVIPHKGAIVVNFSTADLEDIFQMRILLEEHATKLAAKTITAKTLTKLKNIQGKIEDALQEKQYEDLFCLNKEFHTLIYKESKSPRLLQLILDLWESFPKYSLFPNQAQESIHDHNRIYQALNNGNIEAASRAMRCHIQDSATAVLSYLKKKKNKKEGV